MSEPVQSASMKRKFLKNVDTLEKQFLSGYNAVDWETMLINVPWDDHEIMLKKTVFNPLNKSHPLRKRYQLMFLIEMISFLESRRRGAHDDAFYEFCDLRTESFADGKFREAEYSFKHYLLPEFSTVFTLKQSNIVPDGTSELCRSSKEAPAVLSQWLLNHSDLLKGKTLLELGSGTGLCGLVASKCCAAKSVMVTNGHVDTIKLLNENLETNFLSADKVLNDEDSSLCILEYEDRQIGSMILPWDDVDKIDLTRIPKPDLLLAADVLSDSSALPALCKAIDTLFRWTDNRCKLILAETEQHLDTLNEFILPDTVQFPDTTNEFLQLLEKSGYSIKKEEDLEGKQLLYWDKNIVVSIYSITRLIEEKL